MECLAQRNDPVGGPEGAIDPRSNASLDDGAVDAEASKGTEDEGEEWDEGQNRGEAESGGRLGSPVVKETSQGQNQRFCGASRAAVVGLDGNLAEYAVEPGARGHAGTIGAVGRFRNGLPELNRGLESHRGCYADTSAFETAAIGGPPGAGWMPGPRSGLPAAGAW